MGVIPLPKLERCCFCTRKLKVASILIACWSMLAITHSMRILYCPTCPKVYTREGGKLHGAMSIIMWILFFVNMATLCSSFFFLLGIFLHMYPFSADIFVVLGIVSALLMFAHGLINLMQIFDSNCKNPSDTFAHFTYGALWMYFVLIVNSYRDDMINKD